MCSKRSILKLRFKFSIFERLSFNYKVLPQNYIFFPQHVSKLLPSSTTEISEMSYNLTFILNIFRNILHIAKVISLEESLRNFASNGIFIAFCLISEIRPFSAKPSIYENVLTAPCVHYGNCFLRGSQQDILQAKEPQQDDKCLIC